jgi:chemotaxis protein methyltransferase CheR
MVSEHLKEPNQIEYIDPRDLDKITFLLHEYHNFDINNYASTFINRRIVYSMQKHKVSDINEFSIRLKNTEFFELFLSDLTVNSVDFFRDTQAWKNMFEIIKNNYSPQKQLKIWFPDSANGEDLYTFIILLKESGYTNHYSITASTISSEKITFIKQGYYEGKTEKIDISNYTKLDFATPVSTYLKVKENSLQVANDLLKNVTFTKNKNGNKTKRVDIVIFRNSLIHYSTKYHIETLQILFQTMVAGGLLLLGLNEQMLLPETMFKLIDKENKIYQKV